MPHYRERRMTLLLTVRRAAWLEHVHATSAAYGDGLVPVVKGNGYGFGRSVLHEVVAAGHRQVCVGTVHELDVPAGLEPVVLTPTLEGTGEHAIVTVGSVDHVRARPGGRVLVKLRSSMHRYGATPAELPEVLDAAAHLTVEGFSIHLPLAGDDDSRVAEVEAWLPHLPAGPVWVSHLSPASFHALRDRHPGREFRVRVGTVLWHGIPRGDFLHLGAVVLHTERVRAGEVAGYRHTPVPFDGTLVAVGAGSAHGVAPLDVADDDRRSPFHFGRHRMPLLERPHMHTSMCVVPDGAPYPSVGDVVDVQQPLINVRPDRIDWRP